MLTGSYNEICFKTFFCCFWFVCLLFLQAGDKITVMSRINAEWVKGELGGLRGMFPANFVDSVPDSIPQEAEESASDGAEHKVGSLQHCSVGVCSR